MTNLGLVVFAIALLAVSGSLGYLFPRASLRGQWLTTLVAGAGCMLGFAGALGGVFTTPAEEWHYEWLLVPGAELSLALDGLSCVFLLPIFLITLLGSIYGLSYWQQSERPRNGRRLRLFYGTLATGMGLFIVARNSILLLVGWEIMALSAYFLVITEDQDAEVRATGWLYLVATHFATLCLFPLFALIRDINGSYALAPFGDAPVGTASAIMLLAVAGFGLKAGIMPLHIWLPSAHAMAPSHVSAILSGVVIKMGIYGIVRVASFFPHPPLWWGGMLLALGVISGVLGVAFAIGQHDIKRLLAYHSIENIGIIVMGIGLALLGRSLARADWVILGMSGALLHVWNHGLFKALLFLSAGSVIHAAHTRDIDHMGGLARAMPWTSLSFLIGAVAICGLPPLNGFVSELFIYLGLLHTFLARDSQTTLAGAALAAPALALIGTLALACFVKVYTAVFLGVGRSPHVSHAHESPTTMCLPMFVLAGFCIFIGLFPGLVAPILERAVQDWAPEMAISGQMLSTLAPLTWITIMGAALLALLAGGAAVLAYCLRHSDVQAAGTWDCGYAAPSPRMQYTASSFADTLVGLFQWALLPRQHPPAKMELFPGKSTFGSDVPDVVLDRLVLPFFGVTAWLLCWFRWIQRGGIHSYMLYILAMLLILLLWR